MICLSNKLFESNNNSVKDFNYIRVITNILILTKEMC